jgi:hypothetical protein
MVAMRAAMAEQRGTVTKKRNSKLSVPDVFQGTDMEIMEIRRRRRGRTLTGSVKLDEEL